MTDLSELKERIKLSNSIEEIVREVVPLGPHNKALCPFHKEDTPSFFVNVKEQYFHCFGCGAGGDVFNFVMRQKGVSFPEALRYLAERKGIQVSLNNIDLQEEQKQRIINSALAEAAKVYHESLPVEVMGYLKGRGLTEGTINSFRIGFCNGQAKYNSTQEILLNAGLIYEGGKNYFEGYITFPHLLYGRVVYMSGRGYPEKKHKKLEAEKVPLVHLYNEQALSQKEVILAEGEIDTLTLLQHGFNACGVLGSNSFKDAWADRFKNCETVYLSFDADDAGEKGNLKIVNLLGPKARLVSLPEGEDVNDFFKHATKEHFSLTLDDIESYEKLLKSYRKTSHETESHRPLQKEDLIKILEEEQDINPVHPAQGFSDGIMNFAVKVGEELCIITSDKRIFSFTDALQNGMHLKHEYVDTARFSAKGIRAFLSSAAEIDPANLYSKIVKHIGRFIIFPSDAYLSFVALWIMGTCVWLNAEKNSGKTSLMEISSPIAFNGELITSPTESVIFRDISNNLICMFIDEVERYKGTPATQEIEREIRDELYMFALTYAADIFEIYHGEGEDGIAGMEHLNNRELDIWEPVFLLANIIDSQRQTTELTLQMQTLSKEVGADKREDSQSDNDMCKALSVVKPMFEDLLPFSNDNGVYYYEVDKVLEYFKKTEL